MKLVIIESPYAGDIIVNVAYAKSCLLDSLRRGEAPIASHLLYTQVLKDSIPEERTMGIEAGLAWSKVADLRIFYLDLGWSNDMLAARQHYFEDKVPYETRQLGGIWMHAKTT